MDTSASTPSRPARQWFGTATRQTNDHRARYVTWVIVILLAANQFLMGSMFPKTTAATRSSALSKLLGIKTASAASIIAPQINADGRTTRLVEQPTISGVPANPKTSDPVADAKVVMLATGVPAYAPEGISFDDPVQAQNQWGTYETSITLSGELVARYDQLTNDLPCSYCCGQPADVTRNKQCGCAHAKAARGYFKYMLQTYGAQYSDAQLLGEAYRWQALWYPKGAIEDYLLATGRGDVLGHEPHGGAGADGRHGVAP